MKGFVLSIHYIRADSQRAKVVEKAGQQLFAFKCMIIIALVYILPCVAFPSTKCLEQYLNYKCPTHCSTMIKLKLYFLVQYLSEVTIITIIIEGLFCSEYSSHQSFS